MTEDRLSAAIEAENWRATPEFVLLENITKTMADHGLSVPVEIAGDFLGRWQPTLDLLVELPATFKLKAASVKTLPQETLRTAFFGGANKRDEPFAVDNFTLDFDNKEYPKNCRHVKNTFIELLKCVSEADTLEENAYADWRKNKLLYKFKEFVRFYKEHVKKDRGHAETKKLLYTALEPLRSLLEAAGRLIALRFSCEETAEAQRWQYLHRADLGEFCARLQPCVDTLHRFAPEKVRSAPPVARIVLSLSLLGCEDRPAEAYFLLPVRAALNHLLADLVKLHSMGPDCWRQPLAANAVFVEDVTELVERHQIAEELLGSALSSAQTSFAFEALAELNREPLFKQIADGPKGQLLALIIVLRSWRRFHEHFGVALKRFEADLREQKSGSCSSSPVDVERLTADRALPSEAMLAQKTRRTDPAFVFERQERRADGLNFLFSLRESGDVPRAFLWPDFLPEEEHRAFAEQALLFGRLNADVATDIEDALLIETVTLAVPELKGEIEARIAVERGLNDSQWRPPHLWNSPKTFSNRRNFRFSSRIADFEDAKLEWLSKEAQRFSVLLSTYSFEKWKNIMLRVTQAAAGTSSKT